MITISTFCVRKTSPKWISSLKTNYENGRLGKYINFWTSNKKEFKSLKEGELFAFLSHDKTNSENVAIVGGAHFSHFEKMSIADAWEKYGISNGSESLEDLLSSIKKTITGKNFQLNTDIGCIILKDIFFLDEYIYIKEDNQINWDKHTVGYKKYYTDDPVGKDLYNLITTYKNGENKPNKEIKEIINDIENSEIKGKEITALIKRRVNQSIFRKRLLNKYNSCCLCKLDNPSLLRASHIKPWSVSDEDEKLDVNNGFLLCPNHDALFDAGFITFSDEGNIIISKRLDDKNCSLLGINPSMKISVSEENKKYLEYHRSVKFFDK